MWVSATTYIVLHVLTETNVRQRVWLYSYKRLLDSYACPDKVTKNNYLYFFKLVQFSGKRHTVCLYTCQNRPRNSQMKPWIKVKPCQVCSSDTTLSSKVPFVRMEKAGWAIQSSPTCSLFFVSSYILVLRFGRNRDFFSSCKIYIFPNLFLGLYIGLFVELFNQTVYFSMKIKNMQKKPFEKLV